MTTLAALFSAKEVKDLGFELQMASLSEAELMALIAQRVAILMQDSMEEFLQILYRLDIPEAGLAAAMSTADIPTSIAQLILQRQQLKAESRKTHIAPGPHSDDELAW